MCLILYQINYFFQVLVGGKYPDGYDLMIGTSDKGQDVDEIEFPSFNHALVLFGGELLINFSLADDRNKLVS